MIRIHSYTLILPYSIVDKDEDGDSLNILGEKDVTPVGMYCTEDSFRTVTANTHRPTTLTPKS
jgi:hypothetical protein